MQVEQIIKQIEDLYYWDSRVKKVDCNYFSDEVKVVYEDEENDIIYNLNGCYSVEFKHEVGYSKEKPIREYTVSQIPYFIQSVEIKECIIKSNEFYKIKINMHPLELEVLCKEIIVKKVKNSMNSSKIAELRTISNHIISKIESKEKFI